MQANENYHYHLHRGKTLHPRNKDRYVLVFLRMYTFQYTNIQRKNKLIEIKITPEMKIPIYGLESKIKEIFQRAKEKKKRKRKDEKGQ